jgi:hypothetical protein
LRTLPALHTSLFTLLIFTPYPPLPTLHSSHLLIYLKALAPCGTAKNHGGHGVTQGEFSVLSVKLRVTPWLYSCLHHCDRRSAAAGG